jgi:hypothetical protein
LVVTFTFSCGSYGSSTHGLAAKPSPGSSGDIDAFRLRFVGGLCALLLVHVASCCVDSSSLVDMSLGLVCSLVSLIVSVWLFVRDISSSCLYLNDYRWKTDLVLTRVMVFSTDDV